MRRTVAVTALLALSACAALDEGECKTADWRQLGYTDGLKGLTPARMSEYDKSCKDYFIQTDQTAWRIGYAQGLGSYCTASHGYEVGRNGESYRDVCPPDLDREFRPAYEDGRRLASRLSSLSSLDSQLRSIGERLREDDRRANDYVQAMRRKPNPPPPPPVLLSQRDRRQLERDYDALRRQYGDERHAFEADDDLLSKRYGAAVFQIQGGPP